MKNFTVWEIFEYDRGKESTPKQVEDWNCPMINETSENNGLTKYAKPTKVLKGNSITVSVNFAQTVFYQPKDFCASVNIMSLYNEKFSALSYMYVITQLRKKHAHFSYWGKISKDRLLEEIITLPILSNWELAYDYMENYIKEIEAYHIKEIEAYLQSTGLSDYELSKEEKLALESILSSNSKNFRLDELFKIQRWNISDQKTIQESNRKDYVFVAQNDKDNGFVCYVEPNNNKIFNPSIVIWRQTWTIYYQPQKFITTDWVLVLISKNNTLSSLVSLFLVSLLKKHFINSWYSNTISAKKVSDLEITLPVDSDNQINFPLIETYIKATQKLVIKDLVDNINEKLKTYKEII